MSIYKKMKNEKININIDDFKKLIDYENQILKEEIDLIISQKFGKTFDEIWLKIDFKDKIEIICLLNEKSQIIIERNYRKMFRYENLNYFFQNNQVNIFLNKLDIYIERKGYEIKRDKENNLIIVEGEISNLLSESNDENLKDVFLKFRKATTLKDKEAEIFKIQKELYKNIRNDKNKHDVLNIENIKRLNEVFVRHDKEANDKVIKPYYDGLSNKEKIKIVIFSFKIKMKGKNKNAKL